MKRVLSIVLALCMMVSTLTVSSVAYAENIMIPYCEVVCRNTLSSQLQGAAGFLVDGTKSFDVLQSADYLTFLKSGYDMSKYNDAYIASVIDMLKANDGKLVSYGEEDLGLYGAVIGVVTTLGFDAKDFYGFNLIEQFEALSPDQISNPYLYRFAISVANVEFAKSMCDAFIKEYYTLGKGMNYWGYSCDNTAVFLTTISRFADDYSEYVADAKNVLETYTTENGCFYSMEYQDISPDSTAVAIMAYASVGDTEKANKLYKNLCDGFESEKPGVMLYYGAENAYATKDALYAFEAMYGEQKIEPFKHTTHITNTTSVVPTCTNNGAETEICVICDEIVSNKEINATGHNYVVKKTVNATCTNNGSKQYACTNCDATYSEVIFATGHDYKEEVKVYNRCDKADMEIYTCKKCNLVQQRPLTPVMKHSMNKGKVTKAPTSSKAGVMTYTCKNCSYKKTASIAKLPTASISKLTAQKKGFKAQWKKNTKVTGYQIRYSTSSKMSKSKTATITKNSTTSKKISKLSAKKKYYVQIRTYKTINGKKCYSSWSKAKAVTTKK